MRFSMAAREFSVWRFSFRLVFSLTLLYFILDRVNLASVVEKFDNFALWALFSALLCQFASNVAASIRWRTVMNFAHGSRQSHGFYLRSLFRACFINQCLPTIIGGDTLRVVELAKRNVPYREALGGVAIDRVSGFAGLMLLNLIMLPIAGNIFPPAMFWTVALTSAGSIVGVGIGIGIPLDRWLGGSQRVAGLLEMAAFARRVLFSFRGLVLQAALSLSVHILSILSIFILARNLGVQLPLSNFLLILPTVFLLATIPLSISGWGIRESSMVSLFAMAGADQSAILATSVCFGIISLVSTLPGLWFLIQGQHRADKLE